MMDMVQGKLWCISQCTGDWMLHGIAVDQLLHVAQVSVVVGMSSNPYLIYQHLLQAPLALLAGSTNRNGSNRP